MVERIVEEFKATLPRAINECVFILGPSFELDARPQLSAICARHNARPHFVVQHEPLGTAHAVAVASDHLSGEGIVVYADTVFDMGDPITLEDCDVMVWVKHVNDPSRFGVAVRKGEHVVAFVEKPQERISTEALIGIYYVRDLAVLRQNIQHLFDDNIRGKGGEYYLTDAFDAMLKTGSIFKTTSVRHWLDCGTLSAFMATTRHLLRTEPSQSLPPGVSERSVLIPPVYIAPGVQVTDSVIGPNVCIEKDAQIIRSVVQDSILFEGACISNIVLKDAFVGAHATVSPSVTSINVGDFSEIC